MLIGIGADDVFIIANAIDQTSFKKSPEERIVNAIKHAGPTITITSVTTFIAFFLGSTSSLIALKSFCQFAAVCSLMLYLCMLTIFVSMMVWDTKRVHRKDKNGDFCGLCICKEDSLLFCKGFCLSVKQKAYSEIKVRKVSDVKARYGDEEKTDESGAP